MSPRLSQALTIVTIFVLVGPVVGALVFGVLVTVFAFADAPEIGIAFVYLAIAFFPLAYLVGGAQALFAGIVTASVAGRRGSAPLSVPLGAALAAGALVASRSHERWDATAILLAVHLLSAWVCWLLLRRALGWAAPAPISGS